MKGEEFMYRITVALGCIVLFALPCAAQRLVVEHGQLEELRGVTKIYLRVTGDNSDKLRRTVIDIVQSKLPQIAFTGSASEAQAVMSVISPPRVYDEKGRLLVDEMSPGAGLTNSPGPGTSGGDFRATGTLIKYVNGEPSLRMSLYKSKVVEARRDFLVEREPGMAFAQAFVKAYTRANKLKK
jgi:hypothetical protein